MHTTDSIVYVAGPVWGRDDAYARAMKVARATGATLAILSDTDPGGPRPSAIRRGLPENAALAVRGLDRRARHGVDWRGEARRWLQELPCSVWLVPEGGRERSRMVVAALELAGDAPDPLDEEVLRVASAVALAEGARLVAVHAWSLIGEAIVSCPMRGLGPRRARRVLLRVQEEHRRRMDALLAAATPDELEIGRRLDKGSAREVIERTLERTAADVLVLGYRARTGLWGLLQGNLAEAFLDTPYLSIVAVRPARRPASLPTTAHRETA